MMHGCPQAIAELAGPFRRLAQTTDGERAASTLMGVVAFVWSPIFWIGYGILALLNILDFVLGVRVAGANYDGERALNGAISKLTALILLFVFRVLESWTPLAADQAGLPLNLETSGAFTFAATCALILVETKSIGMKLTALGNSSVGPLLTAFGRLLGGKTQEEKKP